jgi:Cof subfamily protein (haloacid dehalogenase superfamily)
MELIVFDLDGTLLNRQSAISDYTGETLKLLSKCGIAYTIATGRTFHGARTVLESHSLTLPQIYKNGVTIWYPEHQSFSDSMTLTVPELDSVLESCMNHGVTPFVFTLDGDQSSRVYHPALQSEADNDLVRNLGLEGKIVSQHLDELPRDASVTHVNSIGEPSAIESIRHSIRDELHLVAYSGLAREGAEWHWLDIHHCNASKGEAIRTIKAQLDFSRVICFGDSDNDISMFEESDESYALQNATDTIKSSATAVIGHHDDEGVAKFLRHRFKLD